MAESKLTTQPWKSPPKMFENFNASRVTLLELILKMIVTLLNRPPSQQSALTSPTRPALAKSLLITPHQRRQCSRQNEAAPRGVRKTQQLMWRALKMSLQRRVIAPAPL